MDNLLFGKELVWLTYTLGQTDVMTTYSAYRDAMLKKNENVKCFISKMLSFYKNL